MSWFDRSQMTLVPFSIDAPGGMNSFMTSMLKPVLPMIFYMQFMYLYRYAEISDSTWVGSLSSINIEIGD